MRIKFSLPFIILCLFCVKLYAAERLIFAIDIIRHGDRTPITTLPNIAHQWLEGPGQLTAEGMAQEFKLGQAAREKYIKHYHLLPEKYNRQTVYVRSTDFDRTIMSAQCFLLGLYPLGTGPLLKANKPALSGSFQPIPIHTLPIDQEKILLPHALTKRTLKKLMTQYVFSKAEWREKNNDWQKKYPVISNITGVNIKDISQFIGLGDTLHIYQLHHVPLPNTLNEVNIQEIIDTGRWAIAAKYKPKEIGKVTGGQLLRTVVSYIKDASHQKNTFEICIILWSRYHIA